MPTPRLRAVWRNGSTMIRFNVGLPSSEHVDAIEAELLGEQRVGRPLQAVG